MESIQLEFEHITTDHVISFAPADVEKGATDIPGKGIYFEAIGCEVDEGDVLRVTYNDADRETQVVFGRVLWADEVDAITSEIGLQLISTP